MFKRLFDIVVALVALMFSSPLWMLACAAIYAHDRGPIFYRQTRVGLNGEFFQILKFRTMVRNADKVGGYSTAEHDPRITPAGRWLRKSSIDELPQLLNVLWGQMSIVGPRPDVPAQRSLYTEQELIRRTSVRPGITGLAQSSLRSQATEQQRKALDLEYIDRAGLCFDLKIILMTARQVIAKGGN